MTEKKIQTIKSGNNVFIVMTLEQRDEFVEVLEMAKSMLISQLRILKRKQLDIKIKVKEGSDDAR